MDKDAGNNKSAEDSSIYRLKSDASKDMQKRMDTYEEKIKS
jgi:hypothetical protein